MEINKSQLYTEIYIGLTNIILSKEASHKSDCLSDSIYQKN